MVFKNNCYFRDTFVCSKHFLPEDYTDFTETELKEDAVPSKNLTPGYSKVCCLPKCESLPRINPHTPVVRVDWPTRPDVSQLWFDSLEALVTSQTKGPSSKALDTRCAKVCTRHFDPRDISAKLTVRKTAVPCVDPAKVTVVTAVGSAQCSVVNCRGSGASAFRMPLAESISRVWVELAASLGNTVIGMSDYVCSRHFDYDCFVEYPNRQALLRPEGPSFFPM